MRLSDRLIARDQAASASAADLADHLHGFLCEAHRELVIAHLSHLIDHDGVAGVGAWLEAELYALAVHHGFADPDG